MLRSGRSWSPLFRSIALGNDGPPADVEDGWLGAEFLQKRGGGRRFQQLGHLRLRVLQVTEDPGRAGTGAHARGRASGVDPAGTEIAFVDGSMRSGLELLLHR